MCTTIDSEFLEDYHHIDVISMGFVREDGQEFYFVLNDFDTLAVSKHGWLMQNVMPSIGHEEVTSHVTGTGRPVKDLVITDPAAMSKRLARKRLLEFIDDIWPEFWAWYGAYDHVALCSLFGTMVDLPGRFPMLTHDIKSMHKKAGSPDLPKQTSGLHNALADAKHNVVRYEFLDKILDREKKLYIVSDLEMPARNIVERSGRKDAVIFNSAEKMRGPQISVNDNVLVLTDNPEMLKQLELMTRLP